MTKHMEKASVLDAFFVSVFTGKTRIQKSSGKVWHRGDLRSVKEDHVRELLN